MLLDTADKNLQKIRFLAGRFVKRPSAESLSVLFRMFPKKYFKTVAEKSRKLGGKFFLLSFDCDNEKDIEVVEGVHDRLVKLGIRPLYAVPGELLKLGSSVYKKLKASGSEFINHGYYRHSRFNETTNLYESFFFYEQLSREKILEDIQKGHETHKEILGEAPLGYRVPHFSTFQKPEQLLWLYETLSSMGYRYSSSTVPEVAYRQGSVWKTASGILEFPVTGCYSKPFSILDSWGFRFDPLTAHTSGHYKAELELVRRFYEESTDNALINIYADPSQVYDWEEFFSAVAPMAKWQVTDFRSLTKRME